MLADRHLSGGSKPLSEGGDRNGLKRKHEQSSAGKLTAYFLLRACQEAGDDANSLSKPKFKFLRRLWHTLGLRYVTWVALGDRSNKNQCARGHGVVRRGRGSRYSSVA